MTSYAATSVAVVGAGPAGLMAAEQLARRGARVTVYERMPTAGRKLLMAGRGGLNLTHSEPMPAFSMRYGPAADWLSPALAALPPQALLTWADTLGQETFVGTSGRIFPKAMKASPLLRAWLARLGALGVSLQTGHRWCGWDDNARLVFTRSDGRAAVPVAADATLLALGGGSWPRLGSDGGWVPILAAAGVAITPLAPANMALEVAWSKTLLTRFEGDALKRIALSYAGRSVRGDAVVTARGLEGGAVYAIAAAIRDAAPSASAPATLLIDLRPDLTREALARALETRSAKQSTSSFLARRAKLAPAAISLLHECHGARLPADPLQLATAIKSAPLTVIGVGSIERAISSAGGVRRDAVDEHFMLRARPGVFVAGEMLDWEAPTGGYLLQATFATAVVAAQGIERWLAQPRPSPTSQA